MIRFTVVFFTALLLSLAAFAQTNQSHYLLTIRYDRLDLPNSGICTYLEVFPDHSFHMEKQSALPRRGELKAFEASLSAESFDSLLPILDAADLKSLPPAPSGAIMFAQGEVVTVSIARDSKPQHWMFAGVDASGTQRAQPLPPALAPLVQWFKSTTKAIEHLRLQPIKNAKARSCGLER